MSSPFDAPAPDPFLASKVIFIRERGTHVPTWYVPHENPDEVVVTEVEGNPGAATGRGSRCTPSARSPSVP